jgi:hypothetical protein
LEWAQGYLKLPNGRALTGQSHDYKRHGTTTLLAAHALPSRHEFPEETRLEIDIEALDQHLLWDRGNMKELK